MLTPSQQPGGFARWAAAVLLSLGLHGLLLLCLWQVPAGRPAPTADGSIAQFPSKDELTLGLDDSPPRLDSVSPSPRLRDTEPIAQASFDVRLANPAPTPEATPFYSPAGLPAAPGPPPTGAAASSSGDGIGASDGSGPCALEVGTTARTVVYVVDRSVSMGFHGALARARREIVASIRRLPATTQFQVIAYNREAEPLAIDGKAGLLAPDETTRRQVADALSALRAMGGTDDGRALRRAIAFHPDVLYFLTDADDISLDDVRTATRLNDRRTVIHTVELSGGPAHPNGPLHKLAADNGGAYRQIGLDE